MNRAVHLRWVGAIIDGRTAILCVLACWLIGCASGPHPAGPGAPNKLIKESTGATTLLLKGDLRSNYRQGLSYLDQGELDKAQQVFESLIQSNPDRIELHNALGVLYRRRGLIEKALGEYQRAITLSAKSPAVASEQTGVSELYNNIAIAYREHGEFKKAEESYRKAIALNPKFASAYYNLGVLYDLYLNRPQEAVRFYQDYERLAGKNETMDVWIMDLEKRAAQGAGNAVGQP
jgi:tetratricopeptide (TPR) repeat protein